MNYDVRVFEVWTNVEVPVGCSVRGNEESTIDKWKFENGSKACQMLRIPFLSSRCEVTGHVIEICKDSTQEGLTLFAE